MLAFSPGEYLKIEGKEIQSYAHKIKCPVFITSSKNEQKSWQNIYDNITSEKSHFLPILSGNHSSKELWDKRESHKEYWIAVKTFLKQFMVGKN